VWEEEDFHIRIYTKELGKVSSPMRTGYSPKGNPVKSEVFVAGLWVMPHWIHYKVWPVLWTALIPMLLD
jgi:hypothetical protein